jgi:hypothetical protein
VKTTQAQDAPTATPAVISLSPAAPAPEAISPAEATPTRTPTPLAAALLEARELANVRADPSLDGDKLGEIRAGETYNVIGRYARWIQFEYPPSPNGRGWVYDELVTITGDAAAIPELDLAAQPTDDPFADSATQTQQAITQTPGGLLTATAVSREIPAPGAGGIVSTTVSDELTQAFLPTFTYPPGIVALAPTPGVAPALERTDNPATPSAPDGFPPLLPIVVLGGVGLIGLAISAVRRG